MSLASIFFLNIHDVNDPLANTRKIFTHRLASEKSILSLYLSVATRIRAKKGLVETYFVVAVICVYVLTDIVLGKQVAIVSVKLLSMGICK